MYRGVIKLGLIGTSLALTIALLFMTIGKLLALPGDFIADIANSAGCWIIRLGDKLANKQMSPLYILEKIEDEDAGRLARFAPDRAFVLRMEPFGLHPNGLQSHDAGRGQMGAWENTIGASDEWFTPSYIFDALGETFDLDVAHPVEAKHCFVPTIHYFSARGLDLLWFDFVWMNPPFGGRNSIVPWLNKFFDHGNGIALTPDRTSAPWFRDAWQRAYSVMFLPKVKFIRPDGSLGKQPGNGTALWASGVRAMAALKRAEQAGLGILALPVCGGAKEKATTGKPGGNEAASDDRLGTHNSGTLSQRSHLGPVYS